MSFRRFSSTAAVILFAGFCPAAFASNNGISAAPLTIQGADGIGSYSGSLDLAIAGMEEGKHIQALSPLRTALGINRNEPCGVIALATLYLHSGNYARAAREFDRAHSLAPEDPLPLWGAALAALAQGHLDATAFSAMSPESMPEAPVIAAYVKFLSGNVADAKQQTIDVSADDPDPLRLELAAFAALKSGDSDRGTKLLDALLARPYMKTLSEDRALILPFLSAHPAQGQAPTLPDVIGFPEPMGGYSLSGSATIAPPNGAPFGTASITYTVSGENFTTTATAEPFSAVWDTTQFPNGHYLLEAIAYDAKNHKINDTKRSVILSNAGAPPSKLLTPEARAEFRQRLLDLLTPRICRKAAHNALAQEAAKRGETETELAEYAAVVAIDPGFGNAFSVLREHNLSTVDSPVAYWRGITDEKIVALTFDDGPNPAPAHTPALLTAMEKLKVHGTFFVIGARAEQCTDLLHRMAVDGNEVANHSYSHANLTYLDKPGVERELCRTSVIVRDATGKLPKFYRPPGGNFNKSVVDAAGSFGMSGAYWTVDGLRFEVEPYTPEQLTQFVLSKARPGSIILLHNAPENTIKALPGIVNGLRQRGYEMVTMSEFARRCKPAGGASSFNSD